MWAKAWRCASEGLLGCRGGGANVGGVGTQGEREQTLGLLLCGSLGRGFQVGDGAAKRIPAEEGPGHEASTHSSTSVSSPFRGHNSLSAPRADGAGMSKAVGMEARLPSAGLPRDRCTPAELSCPLSSSTEGGGPGVCLWISLSHEAEDL